MFRQPTPKDTHNPPYPPEGYVLPIPIGLGFRVPMLVISPYSRGGFVAPVRSITRRHCASSRRDSQCPAWVPNLSAWRRGITGDLTSALNLKSPNLNVPALPQTVVLNCTTTPLPVPEPQVMPRPPDKNPVQP